MGRIATVPTASAEAPTSAAATGTVSPLTAVDGGDGGRLTSVAAGGRLTAVDSAAAAASLVRLARLTIRD